MSLMATVMAFNCGVSVLAVRVHGRTTIVASFIYNLLPLVLFLLLRGERGENRVKPVSVNIHGIRVTERE